MTNHTCPECDGNLVQEHCSDEVNGKVTIEYRCGVCRGVFTAIKDVKAWRDHWQFAVTVGMFLGIAIGMLFMYLIMRSR